MKCFDIKNNVGGIQHKNADIKCLPEIRSHIMNWNGSYIFVGLCWCKVCAGGLGLITLPINVLIKVTLQSVQSVPGSTKQKTTGQNCLND